MLISYPLDDEIFWSKINITNRAFRKFNINFLKKNRSRFLNLYLKTKYFYKNYCIKFWTTFWIHAVNILKLLYISLFHIIFRSSQLYMIEMTSLSPWDRTVFSIHKKACVKFWYWIFSSNNLPCLNYFLIFFSL